MIILDNFLENYRELKNHAISCSFSDVVNPVDGVTYPFINKEIPESIVNEAKEKLAEIFGEIKINAIFLRMSPAGVSAPHMAHTDISMGRYSLMLYLNENNSAGTGLLVHKETGIAFTPESQYFADIVVSDQNNCDAWHVTEMAKMKENRAAIFDANRFHCALPVGGFGESQSESRIVLTVFFDD
jgi:hypothetical protein